MRQLSIRVNPSAIGIFALLQVPEQALPINFVVSTRGNRKSNHIGAQGAFGHMVVSRCRGIGPPYSSIVPGTVFVGCQSSSTSNSRPPVPSFFCCVGVPVPRGVAVIPRAVSLSCFYKAQGALCAQDSTSSFPSSNGRNRVHPMTTHSG